jgi:hypothetical protein
MITLSKNAQAAKDAAMNSAGTTTSETVAPAKNRAKAFFNWSVPKADGSGMIRCDRGLPIFQNPEYPSSKEDLLIALAEKHGGSVEVTMTVRIQLTDAQPQKLTVDDILVAA